MKLYKKNIILLLVVAIIVTVPLIFLKDAEFGGADGIAMDVVTEISPDYQPWFESILEPKSGEIESLLFALQATLGAGFVGFVLGRITSKKPDAKQ